MEYLAEEKGNVVGVVVSTSGGAGGSVCERHNFPIPTLAEEDNGDGEGESESKSEAEKGRHLREGVSVTLFFHTKVEVAAERKMKQSSRKLQQMIRDDIMWGLRSRAFFRPAYSMHANCKIIKLPPYLRI